MKQIQYNLFMATSKYNMSIGDKYFNLTLIEKVRLPKINNKKSGWGWMVRCDCGNISGPLRAAHIYSGHSKSCGCNKLFSGEKRRKHGINNTFKSVFNNYKNRAKKRNLSFLLTQEEFLNIIQKPCVYCLNEKTSYFKGKTKWEKDFLYTGIDRINSNLGYEIGNVQPCCKICNRAKSDITEDEFYLWVKKVNEVIQK